MNPRRTWLAAFLAVVAIAAGSGCSAVAVDRSGGFERVASLVEERTAQRIAWSPEGGDDGTIDAVVRDLLAGGLDETKAVRIALLNNRDLRAVYADLGVAQSALVQSSLLHNPVLDAGAGMPIGGGGVDIALGIAMDVIDLIYTPLRKRVASAALDETQMRVAAAVLDLVWRADTAFRHQQADVQMLEMRRQIAASSAASFELARRLHDAGNVTELDLAAEQAVAEEAKLDVRLAEVAVQTSREQMNAILGLWGAESAWTLAAPRLPDPPHGELDVGEVEARAIEASLDLRADESRILALGEQLGLDRASVLFPEVLLGVRGDRSAPRWEPGPSVLLPIPIFDQGQARLARAQAELQRALDARHALAVRIRALARAARGRVQGYRERALHYRAVQLPVRARVVEQAQLHYNAMQIGPIDLLRAREQQIESAARYVDSLREYWLARADLTMILAGRVPPSEALLQPSAPIEGLERFPFPTIQGGL
jgi:cobalt-zinc-cadmium efflux system outer membrane protein